MKNKKNLSVFLSALLVFCLVVPLLAFAATDLPESKNEIGAIYDNGNNDDDVINCLERQMERLKDLIDGTVIMPFGSDITPPSVNIVLPPEGDREYFIIGTDGPATQECINFILSYTGISHENAFIAQGIGRRNVLQYGQTVTPYRQVHEYEAIEPHTTTLFMGEMITIAGVSSFTLGHPTSNFGTYFATSPHTTAALNRQVFLGLHEAPNRLLGTVSRAYFMSARDVAIVRITTANRVSTSFPWGGSIANFRGTAAVDDSTMSIRGVSGTRSSRVTSTVATGRFFGDPFSFAGKIATLGGAMDGDSGSALIRTRDNAVLGTLNGTYSIGGITVTIYTPALRYQ